MLRKNPRTLIGFWFLLQKILTFPWVVKHSCQKAKCNPPLKGARGMFPLTLEKPLVFRCIYLREEPPPLLPLQRRMTARVAGTTRLSGN